MVNLELFELHLEKANANYNAGEILRGTVFIGVSSKQKVKIKELFIALNGEAKTNWVNKVSDNIYDTSEPYLNDRQSLKEFLKDTLDERGALTPGTHTVCFQFNLPKNLPSSYESEFGYVRYNLHAEIHISTGDLQRSISFRAGFSSRNKTISAEKPICILAQVDVVQLSNGSSRGLRKEDAIETSGFCGFRTGYISASLSVPQCAYVAGQLAPVEVWIENHSRRKFASPIYVNLVQDVHFRSVSYFQTACDTKTVTGVLHTVELEAPERGHTINKQAFIRIPPNAPATSIGNTIITVSYKLRLEVDEGFEIVLPIGVASKS